MAPACNYTKIPEPIVPVNKSRLFELVQEGPKGAFENIHLVVLLSNGVYMHGKHVEVQTVFITEKTKNFSVVSQCLALEELKDLYFCPRGKANCKCQVVDHILILAQCRSYQ